MAIASASAASPKCSSRTIFPKSLDAQGRAYIVDLKNKSGDKAASSEFTLSNAVLDHHSRLISDALDDAGESLLGGASI